MPFILQVKKPHKHGIFWVLTNYIQYASIYNQRNKYVAITLTIENDLRDKIGVNKKTFISLQSFVGKHTKFR